MNKDRARKLKRMLTTREQPRDPPEPPVVVAPAGVLPDEYAAQLVAQGRKTPMLCVGAVPQGDEAVAAWAKSCATYQTWLLDKGRHIAEGDVVMHADTLRRAYRASLTGEPMPE